MAPHNGKGDCATNREDRSVTARDLLGAAGEDARSVEQIMTEMRGPRRAPDREVGSPDPKETP